MAVHFPIAPSPLAAKQIGSAMRAPSISICQAGSAQNTTRGKAPPATYYSIDLKHIRSICASMEYKSIKSLHPLVTTGSIWRTSHISGAGSVTAEFYSKTTVMQLGMRGPTILTLSISRKGREGKTGGFRLRCTNEKRWTKVKVWYTRLKTPVGGL